ncbi:capsid protein [Escherichia coli]|nr:capsid protein [Escherichia coli]
MSNVGSRSHVVCKNVLRLAGELPIGRVLNDLQPLLILHIFCMKGLAPPSTDHP